MFNCHLLNFTAVPIQKLPKICKCRSEKGEKKLSHDKSHTELSFIYGNCECLNVTNSHIFIHIM